MTHTYELARTPAMARRLLQISRLNGMVFDEDLAELAMRDLVTLDLFNSFAFDLDPSQLEAIQFLRDHHGRAVLLGKGPQRIRHAALAAAWLEGGNILILCQPTHYAKWVGYVSQIWSPQDICLFGNPRYAPDEQLSHVEFKDKPDLTARVFITSYGGLIWHNLHTSVNLSSTIIEELDHKGAVNYRWEEAVKGILTELPRPTMVQDVNNLPKLDHRRGITFELKQRGSLATMFLSKLVQDYLWGGLRHMEALLSDPIAGSHVRRHGYSAASQLDLMSLMAISSHLLGDQTPNRTPEMLAQGRN